MKQTFKYIADLEKTILSQFQEAQKIAMSRLIYEELYPKFIQDIVYDNNYDYNYDDEDDDSFHYERTFVLMQMFEPSKTYHRGNEIFGGIETDADAFLMKQNASKWQNQSKLKSEPPISATDFVNIINNGVEMLNDGTRKHSVFGERPPRPFWDAFLGFVSLGGYREMFYDTYEKLTGIKVYELNNNSLTSKNARGTIQIKAKRPKFYKDQETNKGRRKQNQAERKRVSKIKK